MEEIKSPPSEFYYYHGLARARKSVLDSLLRLLADINHIFVSDPGESEFFTQVTGEVEQLTKLINDGEEIIKQNKERHTKQH